MSDDLLPQLFPRAGNNPCGSKALYSSKKLAITVINQRTRGHQRHRPRHLRPYYCARCQGWHLTTLEEYL